MRLIVKEYLAALRERDELDALLPDLLSQMGLEVFIRAGRGLKEYGVDIGAVGSIDGGEEKVYLFSVKAGDLDARDWDGDTSQALRQSMNDIRDVFIPTFMPAEHRGKPVVICPCYGGELKRTISANVAQYEKENTTNIISFSRWDGDKLAALIESNFLREDFLPKKFRSLMRKSLALLDEPETSYQFFKGLIQLILVEHDKPDEDLKALRQINICLWILYVWCREQGNIESAYLSAELSILYTWDYAKKYRDNSKKKVNISILEVLVANQYLYQKICNELIEEKIFKAAGSFHALSVAPKPSNPVDVNLKLFDILGRVALFGIWNYWVINTVAEQGGNEDDINEMHGQLQGYRQNLLNIISNNPILFTPYKDDQAIDIALTAWFLSITHNNDDDLKNWLTNIVTETNYLYLRNGAYPCNLSSYHELINHPVSDSPEYLKKVTAGSILYPIISMIAAIHEFDEVYEAVQVIKTEHLSHSAFQIWYPGETTEDHLYRNTDLHGVSLTDVGVNKPKKEYLEEIFRECDVMKYLSKLSASSCWPIILTACRHHRVPMPIDFFYDLNKRLNETEPETSIDNSKQKN